MRLPELSGFRLEKLLGEDPFGWNFLATGGGTDKQLVRILKSQSTNSPLIEAIYSHLNSLEQTPSPLIQSHFVPSQVSSPPAIVFPFPGWKSKHGNWKLSSVSYLLKLMDKDSALSAAPKIIRGLSELHGQGINHGGLHPGNVFLLPKGNEPVIKVSGFGEIMMPGLFHSEASFLPFYLAPEQLNEQAVQSSAENIGQWDVYSAGVILYQMLCKHLPRLDRLYQQYRKNPSQMDRLPLISRGVLTPNALQIHRLLESERDLVWPDQHVSDEEAIIRRVVEKCLSFDPAERFADISTVHLALERAQHVQKEKQANDAASRAASPPAQSVHVQSTQPGPPPQPGYANVQSQSLQSPPQATPAAQAQPQPKPEPVAAAQEAQASRSGQASQTIQIVSPPVDIPEPEPGQPDPLEEALAEKPGKSTRVSAEVLDRIPFVRRFRSSSILDKAVAVLLIAALIGLSSLTFRYRYQLGSTMQKREQAVEVLQTNIEEQARSYNEILAQKAQSTKELRDGLDQMEDEKARLYGEAQLTRQMLRQSQENGDQFFKLVLENGDSDVPGFRTERRNALDEGRKYYEWLIQIYGQAPYFIVSKANAYYYLGRIHIELGNFEEAANAFVEAERRFEALMEEERNVTFTESLAVAKRELGVLALNRADFKKALELIDQSSQQWEILSQLDYSRTLDCAIEVNQNSLQVVRCHQALGFAEEALRNADEVASQFLALQDTHPKDERVTGGLASAFELLGDLYRTQGFGDKAIDAYDQACDLYAAAIKLNASVDRFHLGLGNSLAQSGFLTNDLDQLRGAVKVLSEVVGRNPQEPTIIKTLSVVYGALAGNQRDGGKISNAIKLEEQALSLLEPIVNGPVTVPLEIHFAYAERLYHLAELRLDQSEFADSRATLKQAITILANISDRPRSRPVYRRKLAEARGLSGFASQKSGDKNLAITQYKLAQADWKSYLSTNPDDRDAVSIARWAEEQLKSLR